MQGSADNKRLGEQYRSGVRKYQVETKKMDRVLFTHALIHTLQLSAVGLAPKTVRKTETQHLLSHLSRRG